MIFYISLKKYYQIINVSHEISPETGLNSKKFLIFILSKFKEQTDDVVPRYGTEPQTSYKSSAYSFFISRKKRKLKSPSQK